MKHTYPIEKIAGSRAAFGRVLADLADAHLLNDAPTQVHRLLRTVDIEVLSRVPRGRPNVVPPPPTAGHDQTIARWQDDIENRFEEYVAASTYKDRVLIGARSRLTLLNWGHLEEELVCGTTVGTDRSSEGRILDLQHSMILRDLVNGSLKGRSESGDLLVVENVGLTFHQIRADWIAFRPDLAALLEWKPDSTRPGRWNTATGDLAVETIWWVDGWWGRAGPAFNDTEAEGHAVILTLQGLEDVTAMFGETTRHFELTRHGRDNGVEVEPISTAQSLPVIVPTT